MNEIPWGQVITAGLAVLTAVAGGVIAKLVIAIRESRKALKILDEALEDDAIDDGEIKAIVTQAQLAGESWKVLGQALLGLVKRR